MSAFLRGIINVLRESYLSAAVRYRPRVGTMTCRNVCLSQPPGAVTLRHAGSTKEYHPSAEAADEVWEPRVMRKEGEPFNCSCGFAIVVTGELDTDPPADVGWGMMRVGDKVEKSIGAHTVVNGQHCGAFITPDVSLDTLRQEIESQIARVRQGLSARGALDDRLQEAYERQHGIGKFDRELLSRYLPILANEKATSLRASELERTVAQSVRLNKPDASNKTKVQRRIVESLRDWLASKAQRTSDEERLLHDTLTALDDARDG